MKWKRNFNGIIHCFRKTVQKKINMKKFKSLGDALIDLRKRGYKTDFSVETFCLYCGDLDMRLNPEEFKVDEEYRFGGDAADEEDTVLVAITSSSGVKGILVDSYGAYSENTGLGSAKMHRHYATPAFV
jgi:hypothetical protein